MTFSQRDFATGQVVSKLNALGTGGGGSDFRVEDLDLEAYADKIPSLMQLTPDVDQYIDGTNSIGIVKSIEPPPIVFEYEQYVLNDTERMLLGDDATFFPDATQNPMEYCTGTIDALTEQDYLITFGDQYLSEFSFIDSGDLVRYTFRYFETGGNCILQYEVGIGGQTYELYYDSMPITSLHIRIKNNSIQFLKINDSVRENYHNAWAIGDDPASVKLKIQKVQNAESEMSADQFIRIGSVSSQNVKLESHLSCYFKAAKGEMSFTIDETKPTLLFANLIEEPTGVLTLEDVSNSNSAEFYVALMYMYGQPAISISPSFTGTPIFSKVIENAQMSEKFTFRLADGNKLEVYNKNVLLGTYQHTGEIKPYFQNIDYAQLGLSEFTFDLGKAYEYIEYHLPPDVQDGVYYHLITDGELFNKVLRTGDFVRFYNQHTGLILHKQ